jgi:ATP-dependent RNA helicase DeaD
MPHSGDDETSRRGRYRARTRSSGEDGAVPNSPVRRGDGRGDGDGGDDDGGDGGASYARKTTKRLTGGAGLPARGSAREGVAGRWGRLVSEREGGERGAAARAGEQAGNGPKGGSAGARGRGGGRGMGRIQPSRGESFLFFFLFSNSHFHFCFFSF